MRRNSQLGVESDVFPEGDIFKSGKLLSPPFYIQDYPHIGTKLRNLLLKTIRNARLLPFGDFFIQIQHLQELVDKFSKDKHFLTNAVIKPIDKMDFDSVLKMCSPKVIDLLKKK